MNCVLFSQLPLSETHAFSQTCIGGMQIFIWCRAWGNRQTKFNDDAIRSKVSGDTPVKIKGLREFISVVKLHELSSLSQFSILDGRPVTDFLFVHVLQHFP